LKYAIPRFTMVLSTNVPNTNFKIIVIPIVICYMFHFVHFQHIGEIKTRFLDIDIMPKHTE